METETSVCYNDFLRKKRKRFLVSGQDGSGLGTCSSYPTDNDQDDYGFEVLEESSNNGTTIKKIHNKHSHKIIITEEKMTDALRELQIEKDSVREEGNESFILSDELRSSMHRLQEEENLFCEKMIGANVTTMSGVTGIQEKCMQIIPWISNDILDLEKDTSNSSDGGDNDSKFTQNYKVEEPKGKRFPRRKYYQPKVLIEELNQDEPVSIHENNNNYYVEFADECPQQLKSSPNVPSNKANIHTGIDEITDEKPSIDEEMMDL